MSSFWWQSYSFLQHISLHISRMDVQCEMRIYIRFRKIAIQIYWILRNYDVTLACLLLGAGDQNQIRIGITTTV
jgi:hypothetical protein